MVTIHGYKNHDFWFIRSKTMANFRKGTWKVRENIRRIVGHYYRH